MPDKASILLLRLALSSRIRFTCFSELQFSLCGGDSLIFNGCRRWR